MVVVIIQERALKQCSGEQRLPAAPLTRGQHAPKPRGARVTSRKSSNLHLHNQAVPFLWGDGWGQWRSLSRHPPWTTASMGGVEPPTFQLTAPETPHRRVWFRFREFVHSYLPFVASICATDTWKALAETIFIVTMWPVQATVPVLVLTELFKPCLTA